MPLARDTVTIAAETPDQPEVLDLLRAADARSASLYPEESRHGASVEKLLAENVRFFVARAGVRLTPVGCGGFALDGPEEGELKRIFVAEAARGRGIGRLILATLEHAARGERIRTMRLETGVKSHEALALYRSSGYRERGPFGAYRPDPLSVFMEKALTGA